MLSAVLLIPLLGSFAFTGYTLIVIRDAAWGVDRGLPTFSQRGEIVRRGWDGFIVALVWTLPLTAVFLVALIVYSVASTIGIIGTVSPGPKWWLGFAIAVPTAVLEIFLYVAWLRAAVYLKATAGLSLKAVRSLIDANRGGFMRLAWLPVAATLLSAVLALPVTLFMPNPDVSPFIADPVRLLSTFLTGLITVPVTLMVATAYGIWGSETSPGTWPPLRVDPTVTLKEIRGQIVIGDEPL